MLERINSQLYVTVKTEKKVKKLVTKSNKLPDDPEKQLEYLYN